MNSNTSPKYETIINTGLANIEFTTKNMPLKGNERHILIQIHELFTNVTIYTPIEAYLKAE